MRTAELPLDAPATPGTTTRTRAPTRRPGQAAKHREPDLFGDPPPVPAANPRIAAIEEAAPEPESPVLPDEPAPPSHLAPDAALLQRVDPRSFRPNEKPDAYLYWLTDSDTADQAMRRGLPIDPGDPVLLSDRSDVLARLAGLAEDGEIAPASITVLRLRRIAAAPFLEPGPAPSCYRLSGQNVPA